MHMRSELPINPKGRRSGTSSAGVVRHRTGILLWFLGLTGRYRRHCVRPFSPSGLGGALCIPNRDLSAPALDVPTLRASYSISQLQNSRVSLRKQSALVAIRRNTFRQWEKHLNETYFEYIRCLRLRFSPKKSYYMFSIRRRR